MEHDIDNLRPESHDTIDIGVYNDKPEAADDKAKVFDDETRKAMEETEKDKNDEKDEKERLTSIEDDAEHAHAQKLAQTISGSEQEKREAAATKEFHDHLSKLIEANVFDNDTLKAINDENREKGEPVFVVEPAHADARKSAENASESKEADDKKGLYVRLSQLVEEDDNSTSSKSSEKGE